MFSKNSSLVCPQSPPLWPCFHQVFPLVFCFLHLLGCVCELITRTLSKSPPMPHAPPSLHPSSVPSFPSSLLPSPASTSFLKERALSLGDPPRACWAPHAPPSFRTARIWLPGSGHPDTHSLSQLSWLHEGVLCYSCPSVSHLVFLIHSSTHTAMGKSLGDGFQIAPTHFIQALDASAIRYL